MTPRPFIARRARRCACGNLCKHGGRITPGDTTVRPRQHLYAHPECVDALHDELAAAFAAWRHVEPVLAETIAAIARSLTDWAARAAAAFASLAELWRTAASDFLASLADLYDRPPDQELYDGNPDGCWRCNARPAADVLGLCTPCAVDLRQPVGS